MPASDGEARWARTSGRGAGETPRAARAMLPDVVRRVWSQLFSGGENETDCRAAAPSNDATMSGSSSSSATERRSERVGRAPPRKRPRVDLEEASARESEDLDLERLIQGALDPNLDPDEIIIPRAPHGGSLARRDLACLAPGKWLNDEIVNYCMARLQQSISSSASSSSPRVLIWNTFFYSALCGAQGDLYDFAKVAKWPERTCCPDVRAATRIVVPVFHASHYFVVVIDAERKVFELFDSLKRKKAHFEQIESMALACLWNLRRWYRDAALRSGAEEEETLEAELRDEWTMYVRSGPQQTNSSDCGLFVIATCEVVGRNGQRPDFDQAGVSELRRRILVDILTLSRQGARAEREES